MADFTKPLNFIRSSLNRVGKYYESAAGQSARNTAYKAARWGKAQGNYYATGPVARKARATAAAMGSNRHLNIRNIGVGGLVGSVTGLIGSDNDHKTRGTFVGAGLGMLGGAGYRYSKLWNSARQMPIGRVGAGAIRLGNGL